MSFWKKHWRLTVPAAVVLCVIMLGVVVLYSTSEPPEAERVYVMPERSTDNPPPPNTGGISLPVSTTPVTPLVSGPPHSATAQEGSQTMPIDAIDQNTEVIEPCCPDDSDMADAISSEPDGVFRAGLTYEAWITAMAEHHEKETDYDIAFDKQVDKLLEFFQQIVAQVPVDKRAEMFANVKSQIPSEDLTYLQEFWEGVPETSDLTPDQTQDKLENFRAFFVASDSERQALNQEAKQLLSQ